MSGYKSVYAANATLDAWFGSGTTLLGPATWYLALFTVLLDANGAGGTEVTAVDYGRVAVTNNDTNFPAASGGEKTNGTAIDFGTLANDWGEVTGAAWFDASSGGNFSYAGPFSVTRDLRAGDSFQVAAGGAVMTEG